MDLDNFWIESIWVVTLWRLIKNAALWPMFILFVDPICGSCSCSKPAVRENLLVNFFLLSCWHLLSNIIDRGQRQSNRTLFITFVRIFFFFCIKEHLLAEATELQRKFNYVSIVLATFLASMSKSAPYHICKGKKRVRAVQACFVPTWNWPRVLLCDLYLYIFIGLVKLAFLFYLA